MSLLDEFANRDRVFEFLTPVPSPVATALFCIWKA